VVVVVVMCVQVLSTVRDIEAPRATTATATTSLRCGSVYGFDVVWCGVRCAVCMSEMGVREKEREREGGRECVFMPVHVCIYFINMSILPLPAQLIQSNNLIHIITCANESREREPIIITHR